MQQNISVYRLSYADIFIMLSAMRPLLHTELLILSGYFQWSKKLL